MHVPSSTSPSLVDFGDRSRSSTPSGNRTITLDVTSGSLTVDFTQSALEAPPQLQYTAGTCTSGVLSASDDPCTFEIAYVANGPTGVQAAHLVIPAEGPFAGALILPATATVDGAWLWTRPGIQYFGSQPLGSDTDLTRQLTNRGDTSLFVESVSVSGAAFDEVSENCSGHTLQAGNSCAVLVRFSPSAAGQSTGTVSIQSDDPANPLIEVPLAGTGIAAE